MLDKKAIAPLERVLESTRASQNDLLQRLREIESEVDVLKEEIAALERVAADYEQRINRMLIRSNSNANVAQFGKPSSVSNDADGEALDLPAFGRRDNTVAMFKPNRNIPSISSSNEALTNRFADRTITQSCTLLLKESGRALHVNELYNALVAGGMRFKGNNPTISIAVSLNRNDRFRKTGPGTFDLSARESLQAVI